MMLFGEKYPDPVRMVSMGEFSHELCGGTHLDRTDQVVALEIISEEGVAAGVRRIVALTGDKAQQHSRQTRDALADAAGRLDVGLLETPEAIRQLTKTVRDLKKQLSGGGKPAAVASSQVPPLASTGEPEPAAIKEALRESARLLNVAPFDVPERVAAVLAEVESLRAQLEQLSQAGDLTADGLLEHAEVIGQTRVIVSEVPGANPNLMRQLIDQLRQKADSTAILFGTGAGDKVVLVAGISHDLVARGFSAGALGQGSGGDRGRGRRRSARNGTGRR